MRDSAALRSVSLAPLAWLALSLFACREDQRSAPLPTPAAAPTMLREGLEDGGPIAQGERRLYRADLAAGWFLAIEGEQEGADFKLLATGPGLKAEADSPNHRQGPERLLLWTKTAGVYEVALAVDGADPDARFSLRVVALHAASERERRRADAFALGMQADSQRRSGNPAEMRRAIATYNSEAGAWRELGELNGEIHALDGVVRAAKGLHDRREVIEASRALAARYSRLPDVVRQARALVDLGEALSELGDYRLAQAELRAAVALLAAQPEVRTTARAWNALAIACHLAGQLDAAREGFERSIPLWEELGEQRDVAVTRANLAFLLAELGENELAWDELERARHAHPGKLFSEDEAYLVEREIDTRLRLGRRDGLRARADRAVALRRAAGDPRDLANAIAIAAHVEYAEKRYAKARELFLQARSTLLAAADSAGAATHLLSAGWCRVLMGEWAAAQESFAEALPVFERAGSLSEAASAHAGLVWAARERGDLHRARRHALAAVSLIEALRASIGRLDVRASLLASRQQYFDLAVDVLMQLKAATDDDRFAAEAFAVSERAHGRFLLEALPSALPPVHGGTEGGLAVRAERVRRADALYRRARASHSDLATIRQCEVELRSALEELRDAEGMVAVDSSAQPVSLSEVQRELLAEDAQLVLYDLGKPRSYLWVVSREAVHTFELAGADDLERRAWDTYRALAASDQRSAWFEAERRSAALAAELLGPALPVLTGRRLLIVREGALLYVPFGALPLPGEAGEQRSLLTRYEVAYLPSASAGVWMRRLRTTPSPSALDVVALAHPLRAAGFSALPFTADEARAIVEVAQPARAKAYIGAEAVKELLTKGGAGEPRVLHLATHGFADDRYPELSGLVFAERDDQKRPRDGLLRAYEVARLRLRSELVVLSACDSGLGAKIPGEGLVGLPNAFLRAGAQQVLASLWRVNDPAAPALMASFYQGVLRDGLSPEAALQRAQLELAAHPRWRQPYYWAGFILIGAG